MTDVNLGDVVEVLDPLFSPTVYHLRRLVYFVVLPSVQNRGVFVSFRCPSSGIHGLLMIHQPFFLCPRFLPLDKITVVQ